MLESANKAITKNFRNQEKELARQIEIQYDTVSWTQSIELVEAHLTFYIFLSFSTLKHCV